MANSEWSYYRDLGKWYAGEAKRIFVNLPLLVKAVLVTLSALLLLVTSILIFQVVKPEPVEPPPTVAVDTTPAAVPDLRLSERTAAEQKLSAMGFTTVQVEIVKEYSSNSGATIVISQKPEPGTVIRKNEPITLYYGSKERYEAGQKEVTLPSVTGLTVDHALDLLAKEGFVKVTAPLPSGLARNRAVVTAQTPVKDTKATLNSEVKLTVAPGLEWPAVEKALAGNFAAWKLFSKAEPLGGEDVQLTLATRDESLTSEAALSERARSYKVGMEQVLGRPLGKVVLVNPGVGAKGDSSKAARRITEGGLGVATARQVCEQEASTRRVQLDWTVNNLEEAVTENQVILTVVGASEATGQEVVVTCKVSGTEVAPTLDSFTVQ